MTLLVRLTRGFDNSMHAAEQSDKFACFVMVRSMWLPSNAFMHSSRFAASAIAVALTWSLLRARSEGAACCAMLALVVQWLVLRVACVAEERLQGMSDDVRADRAVMPLIALCVPASVVCGGVWLAASLPVLGRNAALLDVLEGWLGVS